MNVIAPGSIRGCSRHRPPHLPCTPRSGARPYPGVPPNRSCQTTSGVSLSRAAQSGVNLVSIKPGQVQRITLAGTDVHDWDNIHHEYGHHLQNLFSIANSPGGSHSLSENLCVSRGKDAGLRLAWGEGWPTYFGTASHADLNLAALGIPNLGDTRYTDTKPVGPDLDYDLEAFNAFSVGEGNEISVQRSLWDLYDAADDAGDAGVGLGSQVLWDVVESNQPNTLSQFWNALIAGRPDAERISFGGIFAQHNVAAEHSNPADGFVYAGGAPPTFQWEGNMSCDTGGNARYWVRFYDDALTAQMFQSPIQTATSFTPSTAERNTIFGGPNATLRWVVVSRDQANPQTGDYIGGSRTIVDNFSVTPVTIVRAFSLHAGVAQPLGTLNSTTNAGPTIHADLVFPVTPILGVDFRLGYSRFVGTGGAGDVDIWNLSTNLKLLVAQTTPWPFINAGLGLYYVDYNDLEGGYNVGIGVGQPIGTSLTLEVTANYHSTLTASPDIEFLKLQVGLLWAV